MPDDVTSPRLACLRTIATENDTIYSFAVDASQSGSASDGFAARTDARRRHREVVDRVKQRSKGKSRPDIEADLRTEFERAGIPQTSEQVTGIAQMIGSGWFGLLLSAVRVAAGGQAPPGMRAGRMRLTGERWVDVEVSADPAARPLCGGTTAPMVSSGRTCRRS